MLFRREQREAIARGEVTVTFRAWRRPQARVGGRYRVGAGTIEVDAVERVPASEVTNADARRAGATDREALLELVRRKSRRDAGAGGELFRVEFRYVGEVAEEAPSEVAITEEAVAGLAERLRSMDRRSRAGAWTAATLSMIGDHPRRRAAELAASVGRETQPFKADVRKLKRLGLTVSHEVGYELTPLGRAVLAQLGSSRPPSIIKGS